MRHWTLPVLRYHANYFELQKPASISQSLLFTCNCTQPSSCSSVSSNGGVIISIKKRMTTIYVDSRKRVAGSDSDFEVDLGESLHLQSDARGSLSTKSAWPTASCPRTAAATSTGLTPRSAR